MTSWQPIYPQPVRSPTGVCVLAEIGDSKEGVLEGLAAEGETLKVPGAPGFHGLEGQVVTLVHAVAEDHAVAVVVTCNK